MNEAGRLPRARVPRIVVPAGKNVVVERSAPALQPGKLSFPGGVEQLELDGQFRLLSHDDSSIWDAPSQYVVADAHLDHVIAAQLAVDSKFEQSPVTQPSVLIEPEADRLTCCLSARLAPGSPPSFQGRTS